MTHVVERLLYVLAVVYALTVHALKDWQGCQDFAAGETHLEPKGTAYVPVGVMRRESAASTSGVPLDTNVGEALEEFLQYAQELKRRAAGVGAPDSGSPGM